MLTTRTTTTALAIVALTGSLALGAGLAGSAAALLSARSPRPRRRRPLVRVSRPMDQVVVIAGRPTVGTPDAVQNRSGAQA